MRVTILLTLAALLAVCSPAFFTGCEPADGADSSRGDDDDDDDDDDNDDNDDGSGDSDADADSDGDGDGDWDPEADCDCPDVEGSDATAFCKALNVCPDLGFLLETDVFISSPQGDLGLDIIPSQGTNDCILNQHGCQMFALSTGPVGQANPNTAEDMGGGMDSPADPIPEYQGTTPTGGSTGETICDVGQLRMVLTAPPGAEGFSFDFLFASAEYPEWINMGFNDTFYAILEHGAVNGGATTNISFDSNNAEIEVDVNFFENADFPCDETGSGWEPNMDSGSTGWLRTSYPVAAGDTFSLTFSIHDEGDCIYDSIVFIDNFQWSGDPVVNETTPLE